MVATAQILWLAYGLSDNMTGCEQVVSATAQLILTADATTSYAITIVADRGAVWTQDLNSRVILREIARPRFGVAGALPAAIGRREWWLVHSFGPPLPRVAAPTIYTLYDWGPLMDPTMSLRGRAAWTSAIIRGLLFADTIHALSPRLPLEAPALLRGVLAKKAWLFSAPPSWAGDEGSNTNRDGPLLFVGTAVPRKRLDLVAAAAELAALPTPVVCVGAGTEGLTSASISGRGRVSAAALANLYEHCCGVILLSEYEGLGLPVGEAAAMGRASIVSAAVAAMQPPNMSPYLRVVDTSDLDSVAAAMRDLYYQPPILPLLRSSETAGALVDAYQRIIQARANG